MESKHVSRNFAAKLRRRYFGLAKDHEVIHGQTTRPNRSKTRQGLRANGNGFQMPEFQETFGLDGQGSSRRRRVAVSDQNGRSAQR